MGKQTAHSARTLKRGGTHTIPGSWRDMWQYEASQPTASGYGGQDGVENSLACSLNHLSRLIGSSPHLSEFLLGHRHPSSQSVITPPFPRKATLQQNPVSLYSRALSLRCPILRFRSLSGPWGFHVKVGLHSLQTSWCNSAVPRQFDRIVYKR
jgi:hypothetical protein